MCIHFGSSCCCHNNQNKNDYNNATLILYSTSSQFISAADLIGGW